MTTYTTLRDVQVIGGFRSGILTLYFRCLVWIELVINSFVQTLQFFRPHRFIDLDFGNSLTTSVVTEGMGSGLELNSALLSSLEVTLLLTSMLARVLFFLSYQWFFCED